MDKNVICIYTMKLYSALKKIVSHGTAWINLDDIMLGGTNQSQILHNST